MVCVFHVSELWWACSKFPCAWRIFFTLFGGLILLPQFPGGLENLLLSIHLRIIDFQFRINALPVSWCQADSFSFIVIHRIDTRSQTWWGSFLLALAVHHQIHRSSFCCRWAIVRGCFRSSFRHGTNHNVLSNLREIFWNGCKNTFRNTLYWTKTASDSIHFSRNFLGQNVRELVFGVNIFDLDFRFEIDSVK